MESIDKIFIKAIQAKLEEAPRGTRSRLAETLGIAPPQVTDIVKERRPSNEDQRRTIAAYFKYSYEDFLNIGRALLKGEEPPQPQPFEPQLMSDDEMELNGFFRVPFSKEMRLAAGSGGTIPITDDVESSAIVVHGPSIKRYNAKNLQAFLVGGPSMEPLIADGGIVMADTSPMYKDIRHIKEGDVYVLCWDNEEGECAVKYLRWVEDEKGEFVSIESEDRFFKPKIKHVKDIVLIGKVIWAWREFK